VLLRAWIPQAGVRITGSIAGLGPDLNPGST
jgi:hypothetical protein